MNRIYRKIWSVERGIVVASELAKAKGKGKGARLLQAVLVAGAIAASPAMAGDVCNQTGDGAPPPVATQPGSLACGAGAQAVNDHATALGAESSASGAYGTAVGAWSDASGVSSTAVGESSIASGDESVALGGMANGFFSTEASGTAATALGAGAWGTGDYATSVGWNSWADGESSIALGESSAAAELGASALGAQAEAWGVQSTSVGAVAVAEADGASALGSGSYAASTNSTAVGFLAAAMADNSVALGAGSIADRENTVSVGDVGAERQITNVAAGTEATDAVNVAQLDAVTGSTKYFQATGNNADPADDVGAYAEGVNATASGDASNAIGDGASAYGSGANALAGNATAVGFNALAAGANSAAFGNNAQATGPGSVAVGGAAVDENGDALIVDADGNPIDTGATSAGVGGTAVGASANAEGFAATASGVGAYAGGAQSSAFGAVANAIGDYSTAVGTGSAAVGASSTAVGESSIAGGDESIALGGTAFGGFISTEANGYGSTAAGNGAWANGDYSTSLGWLSSADGEDATAVGAASWAAEADSTALGYGSYAAAPNSVALGAGSIADRENTVSVGDVGAERQIANVAAGTEATDAVNVAQLDAVAGDVGALAASAVQYDDDSRSTVTLAGADGTVISNVAAGELSADSTDAVNGSQLFETNQRVDGIDDRVSDVEDVAANAIQYDDDSRSTVTLAGADGTVISNVAAGELSADSTDAVNGSQLFETNQRVGDLDDRIDTVEGAAANAIQYDAEDKATATLAGENGTVIDNLADGAISAGSMQAVNGSQLHGSLDSVAAALGGAAGVTAIGTISAPTYIIQGASYFNVGDALGALDGAISNIDNRVTQLEAGGRGVAVGTGAGLAIGEGSHAQDTTDSAFGQGAQVGADSGTAVGSNSAIATEATNAVAVGANASVTASGGTAIGEGATTTAANSVALGHGSVADRANTVSVGNAGSERQVTNVAAGTEATDAVNKGQLDTGVADAKAYTDTTATRTVSTANSYTDAKVTALSDSFSNLQGQIDYRLHMQDRRIDRQGAMSAAMLNMATSAAGIRTQNRVGVGVGFQNGESALSVGYQRAISDRAVITIGGSTSGDDTSLGVGAGFGW